MIYTPQIENHPLDADFSLIVQYHLANAHEYKTTSSIDELLFGKTTIKPHLSHQNPNDILLEWPTVTGHGSGTLIGIKNVAPGQIGSKQSRAKY